MSQGSELPNFPSLNLIFELTKERITNQVGQANALDVKANFLLGSASALVSAALIVQAVLLTLPNSSIFSNCPIFTSKFLHSLPLIILLVFYLVVMLTAFLAYKIRAFRDAPDPEELYRNYLRRDEKSTKAEIFRAMLEAYKENDKIIRQKVIWIRIAFVFFSCEAITLVIFLAVPSIC